MAAILDFSEFEISAFSRLERVIVRRHATFHEHRSKRLLFNVSQRTQPSLSTSTDVSAAGTLTLLIKMPATVTFYRGRRRICLPGIISLIIMCIGIIFKLECGPMPSLMAALPNIGDALC